jgi:predicted phosphohydrolase
MALYALGDLHLSFQTDKPMDMFGKVWRNHAKKTGKLNELYAGRLFFLQNNYYPYGDYALVGTKGFCFENIGTKEHADMLVEREAKRLSII